MAAQMLDWKWLRQCIQS